MNSQMCGRQRFYCNLIINARLWIVYFGLKFRFMNYGKNGVYDKGKGLFWSTECDKVKREVNEWCINLLI